MKAILTFHLGKESIILERMNLYDLDMYLMETFNDSADLRLNSRYYSKIKNALEQHNNRQSLKHQNGSIRIFLENDDGTPIYEKRTFNEGTDKETTEIVQKQIRVLYNKDIENYTKYGMNNLLILHYQENPKNLIKLLKQLYFKLNNEYNNDDRNMNNFMNYNLMLDLQRCMFGDIKSLFANKKIKITDKTKYNQKVFDFVHSINFKNLGDLYLIIREDAAKQADKMQLKSKKIISYDPIEDDFDEILRIRMFGKKTNIDKFHQDLIIEDYKRLQQEATLYNQLEAESKVKKK